MTRKLLSAALLPLLLFSGCSDREQAPPPQSPPESSSHGEEAADPLQEEKEPDHRSADEETAGVQGVETLVLTVPEGYTLAKIGMSLEEMGVCTVEEFIAASQTGDYSDFPLVAAQEPDENRCFQLEGYLFPDTYQIYADDPPDAVIRRMLGRLEQAVDPELRAAISASGYTVDQVLTLASIIEKEAFGHNQMPLISSVLYNRLNLGMPLECDVTINYVEGAIKPFIDGDINRYNQHYNTYKCEALPAGAICNPGLDAIRAALSPADTEYLFFVTDTDKNYYYSATFEEHQTNISDIKQGGIVEPDLPSSP